MLTKEMAAVIDEAEQFHLEKSAGESDSEVRFAWKKAREKAAQLEPEEQLELADKMALRLIEERDEYNRKMIERNPVVVPPLPPPEPPKPPPTTQQDVTTQLLQHFAQTGSPYKNVWPLINDGAVQWLDDDRNWKKGYVFACLSELVYLSMSQYEVAGKDRYKVIPSLALRLLLENDLAIDVKRLLGDADIRATMTDSTSFVFGSFYFPQFSIVAIRGTLQRLQDWAIDLQDAQVKIGPSGYHSGFYSEAKSALLDLAGTTPEDKPIYFTGHSLGGALAGLIPQLWPGNQRIMTPYTFASPRFGNQVVANKNPVFAFVRAADPVPHLPPRSLGFRSSGWPPTVIPTGDAWMSGWRALLHFKSAVTAHSMEQYRKLMGEECGAMYYPPDVYFRALQDLLVDKDQKLN